MTESIDRDRTVNTLRPRMEDVSEISRWVMRKGTPVSEPESGVISRYAVHHPENLFVDETVCLVEFTPSSQGQPHILSITTDEKKYFRVVTVRIPYDDQPPTGEVTILPRDETFTLEKRRFDRTDRALLSAIADEVAR